MRDEENNFPMLSVVIPVFNEAESLATLHRELSEVATAEGYDLDVVLVDDGSTDGSWETIGRLAAADRVSPACGSAATARRRPSRGLCPSRDSW